MGAVLIPFIQFDKDVIISTRASVDHHSKIGEYKQIASGAALVGEVTVGSLGFMGTRATVSNQIYIIANVIIGAGGVVVADITESGTYVGVPVKQI